MQGHCWHYPLPQVPGGDQGVMPHPQGQDNAVLSHDTSWVPGETSWETAAGDHRKGQAQHCPSSLWEPDPAVTTWPAACQAGTGGGGNGGVRSVAATPLPAVLTDVDYARASSGLRRLGQG